MTPGLERLRRRFLLAPVSNGNISLMVDLARRNGLPWDAILGAELAGDYKPKPHVYRAACAAFDLDARRLHDGRGPFGRPRRCRATCGLRTAHVARPDEKGPGRGETAPKVSVDVAAKSLLDLADRLGV